MDLPNYFLADLPDPSTLTPQLITDACHTLKQNRAKFLATQSTLDLLDIIARLAREWLDPHFPYRRYVIDHGPSHTGFGKETITSGLDSFFAQLTPENLEALIAQDLGSTRRLDQFVATDTERKQNRASLARGPELLVHITGGVLPNPALTSIILGLLIRSAQFVKCASGTSFIPRIFAHSLYAMQPKLGACLEIAEWKGGTAFLETPLFAEAACVTATGSDETIAKLRASLPAHSRLVSYGQKLSFAYVTRESMSRPDPILSALAKDISAWNQLGCLSPHAVYVESGGPVPPELFAEKLADALADHEQREPRGTVPPHTAGAITTRRMAYETRAAVDRSTRVWKSPDSTAWTVIHDASVELHISCLHRFIHVKPVGNLQELLANLEPLRGRISTVALAVPTAALEELATRFAHLDVPRICRVGLMQSPPLSWRHDGRPSLADLVTWTDLEF